MSLAFLVSYVALWIIVAVLILLVAALYRVHGQMLVAERGPEVGIGPEVGKAASIQDLRSVDGHPLKLGRTEGAAPQLSIYITRGCSACKESLLGFREFYDSNIRVAGGLNCIVVALGQHSPEELGRVRDQLPSGTSLVYAKDWRPALRWNVKRAPWAVIVDGNGVVRGSAAPVSSSAFESFSAQVESKP